MADEAFKRDENHVPVIGGVTDDSDLDTTQIRVDSVSKRLLVDATAESEGHGSLGDGFLTLATANATAQLASSTACKRVFVSAHEKNRGVISLGGATVSGTLSTRTGITLYPTQGAWLYVNNLNLVHVIADTDNSTAQYYYEN